MMRPFFSFIIPVYNVEKYLPECIESILNQSFTDYEIILVNDGSTDNSLEICNYYKQKDARVKLLDKENEGLAETRNKGIKIASGEYLIFLDSDDHLEKKSNGLSELFNILKCKDVDVLLFNLTPFSVKSNGQYDIYKIPKKKNVNFVGNINEIFERRLFLATACNKIIKRKVVVDNKMSFPKGLLSEDVRWCGDILKATLNIKFYSLSFYFYRKNREGSITYKISRKNLLDIILQLRENYMSNIKLGLGVNRFLDEYYAFYYLGCLKQVCEHEDFSLSEIVEKMEPLKQYLSCSSEKRIVFFKYLSYLIGFKNSVILFRWFLMRLQ